MTDKANLHDMIGSHVNVNKKDTMVLFDMMTHTEDGYDLLVSHLYIYTKALPVIQVLATLEKKA